MKSDGSTVKLISVEWIRTPSVASNVIEYVPIGIVFTTDTVSVAVAELFDAGATVKISNSVVTPSADFPTDKATGELKLKMEFTDTCVVLDDPRAINRLVDDMPKSPE